MNYPTLKVSVIVSALVVCVALACGCRAGGRGGAKAGTMVYVGRQVVKNYRPRPALVTEANLIDTPKFPVIDVHCHWPDDLDPARMVQAMDERGIRAAVNLSGDHGPKLERMLEKFHRFAPDRFFIFCSPDFSLIDEPDFGGRMEAFIREARCQGAAGVKIYKNLGLTIRDSGGRLVPVDDPRLETIWATAGRLNMPVLIHTADPVAFFEPVDRHNERWMQLKRHPDWSFHGRDLPARDEILAQRNRVIEQHPNTNFIGAHVGNSAENLGALAQLLRRHRNLFVDISGRVAELGRQPYVARRFFEEFQDRILFGTDRYPGREVQPRYRVYYRFLETMDEYFDYYDHPFPPTGEWKIYGIGLPDAVLSKVYQDNALKLLGAGAR
jgi:predicted TIM-barrel fold metal-dependent hydrolase